ncbi:MAG: phage tail sheath protein [Deltaproteobacteria bacterium]|nr:phage tail sheath protein [Deltaproteobacteria bacterium]
MPEAQQAFQNGVFELVVVDMESTTADAASVVLQVEGSSYLTVSARARGTRPNDLEIRLTPQGEGYEMRLLEDGETLELYRNVSVLPGDRGYIVTVLDEGDSEIGVQAPSVTLESFLAATNLDPTGGPADALVATIAGQVEFRVEVVTGLPLAISEDAAGIHFTRDGNELFLVPAVDGAQSLGDLRDALATEPGVTVNVVLPAATGVLAGGVDASEAEYVDALTLLEDVADVDMVAAALQDHGSVDNARASGIYSAIISHCELMSADARGRIGFGQVSADAPEPADGSDTDPLDVEMADLLRSDRFVLLAPHGALGAAAGRIGSLPYYQSPTFKTLSGLGDFRPALRVEQQRQYLQQSMVPIAEVPGRGISVVRGLTTDGDQINVRRIADRAVRGVRVIGELFIGKLNTEDGRNALKQKLTEFLLQMQAEDAIVPSTDGTDPAFKLDVYSSQSDFAQGIVRVDLAVRPVRAIDFIYATVLVQV